MVGLVSMEDTLVFSKGSVDKRPNIILLKHLTHFIAAQEHNLKGETMPFRKKIIRKWLRIFMFLKISIHFFCLIYPSNFQPEWLSKGTLTILLVLAQTGETIFYHSYPMEHTPTMDVNLVVSWCLPMPVPALIDATIWTPSRPTHSRFES